MRNGLAETVLDKDQTRDDLNLCITGFIELYHTFLCSARNYIVPSRVNSDVTEKMFCQRQGLCNGNNTNTTFYQYLNKMNSVLLEQQTHNSGFDSAALKWMMAEAEQNKLPEDGYKGGLVFDEMAIPKDIQITKNGDAIELDDLVDVDEEANACQRLRKGKQQKALGTHILQLLFIGLTGFRFPFAHFVTKGIRALQL
ncbi:hypothetical protein MAR_038183 [Mya arenaria]|uniref:Uncharacterized protein n=1 Tax=Mya arenaria TaxID=6604 RepID=A0ABY7FUH1_MYAAR|nr:hypothetical protein MAR_038183 [Mya arenaria]